jgi:hypothetical protein
MVRGKSLSSGYHRLADKGVLVTAKSEEDFEFTVDER